MTICTFACLAAVWTTALQQALNSSADWTMERQTANGGRTIASSGSVECVANSGIVWRVTAPFASSVAMTREAMVFTDEEGVRERRLADLPHYSAIRDKTDAFAAGDEHAFDGLFKFEAKELGDGAWRLTLTPEISDMRRLFTAIELTGNALPTNAVMRYDGGGHSTIRFRAK